MDIVAYERLAPREMRGRKFGLRIRSYFGAVAEVRDGPQVFTVEMPQKGSTIDPHFHDVDQFQLVLRGNGRIGIWDASIVTSDRVDSMAFHYADAYTPYGPIVAGDAGLEFLTVRAACAGGHFPMPAARRDLPGKPGRTILGRMGNADGPMERGQSRRNVLVETDDGVRAVELVLGPHVPLPAEAGSGRDQFYMVCSGSLVSAGGTEEAAPLSIVRTTGLQEEGVTLRSGGNGARVLMMQFAERTARHGSGSRGVNERSITAYRMPEDLLTGL